MSELLLTSIGTYYSEAKAPYEAARQPLERVSTLGEIILESGKMFEQALEDLQGFERIWVVYHFHHNANWKPKVMPPRGSEKKVGVFATRAPYRPNPIGLSCVKLVSVNGLCLTVEGADLLDGTPIFDIKPYLPYADAFPESATGWLGTPEPWSVHFTREAEKHIEFLKENGVNQLRDFILNQLEHDPLNQDKKRVALLKSAKDFKLRAVLAYKTWRARFAYDEVSKTIQVERIFSGYSESDLHSSEDRYADKSLHHAFNARFP